MSTLFAAANSLHRRRVRSAADLHESNSWTSVLDRWLLRIEQSRQLASLREIADDPHLLNDLGLTRDEALSGHVSRKLEED